MNLRSLQIASASKMSRILWALSGKRKSVGKYIPILGYHRVLPDFKEGDTPMYSVLPKQFTEQMKYLAENNFVSLSLTEYDEILRGERDVPPRAVVVTFDDGYADIYSIAWPLAQHYGIKLNIFLCTGFIGSKNAFIYPKIPLHAFNHREAYPRWWRPLRWQEIKEMHDWGLEFGFHGHTHRKIGLLSVPEMHREFERGLKLFRSHLGAEPKYFAFPHGTVESYNNQAIVVSKQYGMKRIFTTRLKRTSVESKTNLISRLVIHQEDDLRNFELKLYGAYDWLGDIRHLSQLSKLTRRKPDFDGSLNYAAPHAEQIVGDGQ